MVNRFGIRIAATTAAALREISASRSRHAPRPDGYTLLLGNVGAMAINPYFFPKFPVGPLRGCTLRC